MKRYREPGTYATGQGSELKSERSFGYQQETCSPDSEYPHGGPCLRPYLWTKLSFNGRSTRYFRSLLDTGADRCGFPLEVGIGLGIVNASDRPDAAISGAGHNNIPAFRRDVEIEAKDLDTWSLVASFTPSLDGAGLGVLGGIGFFDRFQVRFDMRSGLFHVTASGRTGSSANPL
jgi:hypothetical protein